MYVLYRFIILYNFMCMRVQKIENNHKKKLAIELLSRDNKITQRELAEQLEVNKNTINAWFKDPEFIDAIYDRFMIIAGKHLPSVVMALINEAKVGNVRAAELVLKHFNKLQDRVHIEINAPFMQFMSNKNIDDAELVEEDAILLADNIEITNDEKLPPRNPIANTSKNPKNKLNKENIGYKKQKYRNDINSRYFMRKRAKKVGLEPLPSGKPKSNVRRKWLQDLIKLEKQNDIWYADHDHIKD